MMERIYDALVEEAATSASETGIVDLVHVAQAAELGFDTNTFTRDVAELADVMAYVAN